MKTEVRLTKDGKSAIKNLDMARLFLEIAGGGLNVQQTMKAMNYNHEFNENGKITINGFLIEKVCQVKIERL